MDSMVSCGGGHQTKVREENPVRDTHVQKNDQQLAGGGREELEAGDKMCVSPMEGGRPGKEGGVV